MKLKKFEIVESIAGRDVGLVYLVSDIIDENYVMLIDGNRRTLNKPKKKKYNHVRSLGVVKDELESTFYDKSKINDGVIKKILKNFEKIC